MSFQIKRDKATHRMLTYGSNVGTPTNTEDVVTITDDSQLDRLQGILSATVDDDGTITVVPLPTPTIKKDEFGLPDQILQTTNATQTELARFSLSTTTMYVARFELRGIDLGNGNRRYIEAAVECARLSAGAIIDSITTLVNSFNNATSQAWTANAILDGAKPNDVVIVVTGQAGRTIEWVLETHVKRFRPQGLT